MIAGTLLIEEGDETTSDLTKSIAKLTKQVSKAEAKLSELREQLQALKSEQKLYCGWCKTHYPLKSWTFIQDQYYVQPYSCTGGDYWTHSDDNFAECGSCNKHTRLYDGSSKSFIKSLNNKRHLFGKVVVAHNFGKSNTFYQFRLTPTNQPKK